MMMMQTSFNRRPVIIPRLAWLLVVLFSVFTHHASAADEDDQVDRFPGGAPLKTDPELERLLERAEKFAEDGRYDLASILWQKVLEESSDTLMTRDGRKYTSLAEEVERTIAKLPKTGLRVYRITADGEAKAMIASGKGDEEAALAGVVKKYFLSSLGDDAAYKLGCLALDRYQEMFGDCGLSTEVRYINGAPWRPGDGLSTSVRLDVVEGDLFNPTAIFDYKFGGASLSPNRINQIQRVGGFNSSVPILEVHP